MQPLMPLMPILWQSIITFWVSQLFGTPVSKVQLINQKEFKEGFLDFVLSELICHFIFVMILLHFWTSLFVLKSRRLVFDLIFLSKLLISFIDFHEKFFLAKINLKVLSFHLKINLSLLYLLHPYNNNNY